MSIANHESVMHFQAAAHSVKSDQPTAAVESVSPLDLPFARATNSPSPVRDAVSFVLPNKVSAAVNGLTTQNGCTLFEVLVSAWTVLLFRYSGQADFAIATVLPSGELSLVRCEIRAGARFVDVLQSLRAVEVVRANGDTHSTDLVQVGFVLEQLSVPIPKAAFTLCLVIVDSPEGLHGMLAYAPELFDRQMMERVCGHFEVLLRQALQDPACRIADLPLLTETEKAQLQTWNDTATVYPADKCIHELFEEQVANTPDTIAVVFEQEKLTYAELNAQANQLAYHLRSLGVGPDVRVGLFVDRSVHLVLGMLAIAKASGAYVPMDPAYPRDRLAYMLADAHVSVLLTHARLCTEIDPSHATVVRIDTDVSEWRVQSQENLENLADAENLAYVIYTSGSMGKPKGVENRHRGLTNLVQWFVSEYRLGPSDTVAQQAAMGFDACSLEVWPALCSGAGLHIVDEETRLSPPCDCRLDGSASNYGRPHAACTGRMFG